MKSYTEFLKEELNMFCDDTETEEEIVYETGVYISVKMAEESYIALKEYADKYLKDCEFNEDQHCTIIYSKKEHKGKIDTKEYRALTTFKNFEKFGKDKDALVVELKSELLKERNEELVKKHNFISDFGEYKPHFTISYNAKNVDINSLPEINFAIYFEDETVEPLDEKWSSDKEDKEDKIDMSFLKLNNEKDKNEH